MERDTTPTRTAKPPAAFIHDFVPLGMSHDRASDLLTTVLRPEAIARLVARASNVECADTLESIGHRPLRPEQIMVTFGPVRTRADATVFPIAWEPTDPRLGMALEADLEIAAYGADRCHLHLLGRARLKPGMRPATPEASLFGRLAVAIVRHVLDDLAQLVTLPLPTTAQPIGAIR